MSDLCPDCVAHQDELGTPSRARWVGPNGGVYCSMHFVRRFGHAERLVRVEGYQPPTAPKQPVPRDRVVRYHRRKRMRGRDRAIIN